ncbi:MAG: hypothetical protein IAF58_09820 [Leptolyngbya sp.]|nr:hypothetical protein [Candidatus Melainabacteria bacterium]
MPALSIIARNDAPHLTAPRQAPRLVTRDGETVDPFLKSVEALVAYIKAEYGRSFAADLVSCPTQRVSMPEEFTKEQIGRAVELVKEDGWEIYPTYCGNMKTFWVRTHDLFA